MEVVHVGLWMACTACMNNVSRVYAGDGYGRQIGSIDITFHATPRWRYFAVVSRRRATLLCVWFPLSTVINIDRDFAGEPAVFSSSA
jgi:hypothetical protein